MRYGGTGICLGIIILLMGTPAAAQETALGQSDAGVAFRITGGLQPRLSYGYESGAGETGERIGFGLRRGRIDATISIGSNLGVNYDVDFGRGTLSTVDLFGFYQATDRMRIRFGYFAQAQPRAYVLTSFVRVDGIERASIAERWARATTGSSGRDFGLDVTLTGPATTLVVGVHNGAGSFSSGNYRQSIAQLAGEEGNGLDAMAYSMYINQELLPGLEIGGFASYNGTRSENTAISADRPGRRYASWSSHLYWGPYPGGQPLRLKLDIIGLHYEAEAAADRENRLGFALTGAVRVLRHGEFYASIEHAGENSNKGFFASGISYSLSARKGLPYYRNRITLGYQGGFQGASDGNDQHLIVLQSQIVF